jgi:glycosyltransferase involved in cell wall biosynthesis
MISAHRSAVMLVHDQRIDRRVLDEARSLTNADWKVTVIAAPAIPINNKTDEETYPEIEIVRAPLDLPPRIDLPYPTQFEDIKSFPWRGYFYCYNHFYAEAIQRPAEVYVAHDLPQLLPAALAAAYHHSYLVYDAHEYFPEQGYILENKQHFDLVTAVEAWIAPFADQVITVNKSIAEYMVIRNKIDLPEVILNCPALYHTQNLPILPSKQLNYDLEIPFEKQIILFQGGYAPTRNLENLVRAMSLIKNDKVVLVLLGPGFEYQGGLYEIAQNLGLVNNKVYFHSAVPQHDLLHYTAAADAGIIPYHFNELNNYYCTPNKLFEYIVAGIPILANDLPELNRFVSGQKIGLNLPMSTDHQIAEAIDIFFTCDLPSLRQTCGNLSGIYTWDSQCDKLIQIYDRLFNQPPRATSLPGAVAVPEIISSIFNSPRQPVELLVQNISTENLQKELQRRISDNIKRRLASLPPLYRLIRTLYNLTFKTNNPFFKREK